MNDESLLQDEPLKLEVVVSGHPKPDVNWFKDETKLKSGKNLKIEKKENTHSISIAKSTLTDAGKYKAQAVNAAGEVISECLANIQGKMMQTEIL